MKIKNRFDRVLKMLTVFAMTLSCFTDMPIRVVAESFDVDSVISIESHNNGTDANDSEASLAVSVTVNGQTVTAPKSVAPGTLTVRANEGYEIDSMILDGTEFNESTDVQAGEQDVYKRQVFEKLFVGKTIAEVEDWFAKYTDANGRPLQAEAKSDEDKAKFSALTDDEKKMLEDVRTGATISLKDGHGDFIQANKNAYENRRPITLKGE